ncbi:DUF6259 domain-containing protein [Microbacterium sp. cf332]|uniref:DUF6259 domain-containing protein n=1 Tax=Microbacterium sp. cf332 TaxID=1761804 RepID=UPI000887E142|nr:DUF6259 domain-containing protein [Microbacterium sp. cf332]SDQ52580.1 hypothetical protein SAMN04487847_1723 [Microbacterium sp. cf332]
MTQLLTLEDPHLSIAFDARTGGLVRFDDGRVGPWLEEASAGSLFVVEIPRGGDRTVVVQTSQQTLSGYERDDDAGVLTLRWTDPVTSTGETLRGEIVVTAAIDAGVLRLGLALAIEAGGVEAVRFPSLRGVRPASRKLELRGVDYSTGTRVDLLPVFDSNAPYWGTMFPDYASGNLRPELVGNPTSPFVALVADAGGITVLPAAPTLDFIGWRASLEPGYADSLARMAGPDAAVTLDAIHFPAPAEGRIEVPTMALAPYAGEWTGSIEPYRRNQAPTRRSRAAWLGEPRLWLQVQLMSTEGEPRYDFDDLVDIIEECASAGIGAIQIVGWNEGGQDGLVPWHRPAAKLGGAAGLRRALDRARELDVATVLYVKYVWVEKPGPNWDELERFVSRDPNGQPYAQPGPVYHSSRKRYGISTPWYVPLCFGVRELRERIAAEVAELASWGADGVLADESLYHGRALLCFADDHGHPVGASAFTWDAAYIDDIRARLGDAADTFVIAAEGAYDAQFEDYDVSYFRSASAQHRPVGRMLRPDARIVTALTGFDEHGMIAQSILDGYAMSLEPFNFKGRPRDMPATVARARLAEDVRGRYADWLWNGEPVFDDTVTVADAGGSDGAGLVRRTVWRRDADDPSRLVVVANFGDAPARVRIAGVPHGSTVVPLDGSAGTGLASTGAILTIDPRDAVVVVPPTDPIGTT